MYSADKYRPFAPIDLPDRKWPQNRITRAPVWCSVDLRDGNQALVTPMHLEAKLELFHTLVQMGFREIEVGFPSSSQTEYDTVRALHTLHRVPDDVWIQVLTQAREPLIRRTFESIQGARRAIVHLYTNTSPLYREVVFQRDRLGVMEIAVEGARLMRELAADCDAEVRFEFSPESFSATEPDYAVEVCDRVMEALQASPERKVIINLPSTVQISTPNAYADLIEYFIRKLPGRDSAIISTHPHNDRGTGVADAEMALLAGVERVEGTLFGNGERTGNLDLVTLGLNLYTQGVDPGLDFSGLSQIRKVFERTTGMRVHERSPYAGDLVFTAFSGSHQDAIRKGFEYRQRHKSAYWQMPYIPIDPEDLGRAYEPIIRINSQSGKGGAAFVLSDHFGFDLPRAMHPEFGAIVKTEADQAGAELAPEQLLRLFIREYCDVTEPYKLVQHDILESGRNGHSFVRFTGTILVGGEEHVITGEGNGPIDAFFSALRQEHIEDFTFVAYHEHAVSSGSDAKAAAYIQLNYHGRSVFGVGIESNVSIASIKGVLSAVNRAIREEAVQSS